MMEHYLRDLLGYYLETMIHENGNYLMGYNRLKMNFIMRMPDKVSI